MSKILKARFIIPKNKIKNANAPLGHIIAAQRSAWIREYSVDVWGEAIREQFNIEAIEPSVEDVGALEYPEEVREIQEKIQSLTDDMNEADSKLKELQSNDSEYKSWKKERTSLKRKAAENFEKLEEIEQKIFEYEEKISSLKALKVRRKASLASFKKSREKDSKKLIRKTESNNKKKYIEAKIKANAFQHIFEKCFVVATVHNITNRDFDSPNFYPSLKPILDAGTDTGVLWEDDNNRIIRSTTFLPGTNLDRNNYILDIEIFESIEEFYEKLKEANDQ